MKNYYYISAIRIKNVFEYEEKKARHPKTYYLRGASYAGNDTIIQSISQKYFNKLSHKMTAEQLYTLTKHRNGAISCYAFDRLCGDTSSRELIIEAYNENKNINKKVKTSIMQDDYPHCLKLIKIPFSNKKICFKRKYYKKIEISLIYTLIMERNYDKNLNIK